MGSLTEWLEMREAMVLALEEFPLALRLRAVDAFGQVLEHWFWGRRDVTVPIL